MGTESQCVDRLVDLVGLPARPRAEYNWAAVESSLGGIRLPTDYRVLAEVFPEGWFRESVRVRRPGDDGHPRDEYLGYLGYRLEDMRGYREIGHGQFPYPLYPEPGGVLPWGEGRQGGTFFWLMNSPDPERWPVVWSDDDHSEWPSFTGTACELLIALVEGRVDVFGKPGAEIVEYPAFKEIQRPPRGRTAAPPRLTTRERWGERWPANDFAELSSAMAGVGPVSTPVDWSDLRDFAPRLPSDYTAFVDRFRVGTFCDIRIVGPDPCADFDLCAAAGRLRQSLADRGLSDLVELYPGTGGLLPWGQLPDGTTCTWWMADPDPDRWSVALLSPDTRLEFHDELSFSAFLLKYCGQTDQQGAFVGRTPWTGGLTFEPHAHG